MRTQALCRKPEQAPKNPEGEACAVIKSKANTAIVGGGTHIDSGRLRQRHFSKGLVKLQEPQ